MRKCGKCFLHGTEPNWTVHLIEITADILGHKEADGSYTVDHILDTAGQKGTGKWTAISALDEGVPLTLIGEAVFARCLSAAKEEREGAAKLLSGPARAFEGDRERLLRISGKHCMPPKLYRTHRVINSCALQLGNMDGT